MESVAFKIKIRNFNLIINNSRLVNSTNTDNYVVKTCNRNFDLCMRFITHLNAFADTCACSSTPQLKGPDRWSFPWSLSWTLRLLLKCIMSVGTTLVDVRLNWLNRFHFLILIAGLVGCMLFLSSFLGVIIIPRCYKEAYISSLFPSIARIIYLQNAFLWSMI